MKTRKTKTKPGKKGAVLALVMTIGVCLAFIGIGLLAVGLGSRIMAVQTTSGISARAAADAGITRALYEMKRTFVFGVGPGPLPPDVTDQSLPNTYASFTYHVDPPILITGENYWLITSTGTAGRETKTVHAMATVTNLFEFALIVSDTITLHEGTLVGAYDSTVECPPSAGTYALKIGSNRTEPPPPFPIRLNNNVFVQGHVLVGPMGDPEELIWDQASPGATTGPRYTMPFAFEFQHIDAPTSYDAPALGVIQVPHAGSRVITAPVSYTRENPYTLLCDEVDIGQSGILTFVGHVALRVTGDITFGGDAELYIGDPNLVGDPNWVASSLTIYLDGNLEGKNAGGINNLSAIPGICPFPANFMLLGTGPTGPPYQQWDIKNSRNFFGIYYGENADIIIYADADICGSVSGHSFELKNSGNLYYDVQLSEIDEYDTGFRIVRWWEE